MKFKLFLFLLVPFLNMCSSDGDDDMELEVADVQVEILAYNYEVNTENQTELLEFEIRFTNNSSFDVSGAPRITYMRMDNPDVTSTRSYNLDELPFTFLASGGECNFSYSNTENYNPELYGPEGPAELQIVDVEYIISEEFR